MVLCISVLPTAKHKLQGNRAMNHTETKKRRSMMTYFLGLCFLLATGLSLYVFLGPKLPGMQEGMWEITAEIKMPDAQASTSLKSSQRLTRDEHVPEITLPGYKCQVLKDKYASHCLGNHVLWRIQCDGPQTVQGTGHVKYSGDTVKGKVQLRTIGDEHGQKRFNAYISGFRTGT